MIKIGNYTVLETHSLIIPPDEVASIETVFSDWHLKITLIFSTSDSAEEASLDVRGEGSNHAILTFKNWINGLGTSTTEPVYLGQAHNGGLKIYFMIAHWLIGSDAKGTNKVDLQFLSGGL